MELNNGNPLCRRCWFWDCELIFFKERIIIRIWIRSSGSFIESKCRYLQTGAECQLFQDIVHMTLTVKVAIWSDSAISLLLSPSTIRSTTSSSRRQQFRCTRTPSLDDGPKGQFWLPLRCWRQNPVNADDGVKNAEIVNEQRSENCICKFSEPICWKFRYRCLPMSLQ